MHIYTLLFVVVAALLLVRRIATLSATGWRLITLRRQRIQHSKSAAPGPRAKPESATEPGPLTVDSAVNRELQIT